jgi:hypothetical protein
MDTQPGAYSGFSDTTCDCTYYMKIYQLAGSYSHLLCELNCLRPYDTTGDYHKSNRH